MLRLNGFKKSHIKTFFADSGDILGKIFLFISHPQFKDDDREF